MNVFKTKPGKFILFVLTALSIVTTIVGVFGVVLCYDYNIYDKDYVLGETNRFVLYDEAFMIQRANELVEKARKGILPLRTYTYSDYGFYIKKDFKTVSTGVPNDDFVNPLMWGFSNINTITIDDYSVEFYTIWNNNAKANIESRVVWILNEYKAYWQFLIIGGGIASLIFFVGLMCVSGRRNGTKEVVPGALNIIHFDVELAIVAGLCGIVFALMEEVYYDLVHILPTDIFICLVVTAVLIFSSLFVGICMDIAARVKQHNLLSHTLIGWIIRLIIKLVKKICNAIIGFLHNLPFIWVGTALVVGITLFEFVGLIVLWRETLYFAWFLEKLFLVPALIYILICMHRLNEGAKALSEGDLAYKCDTHAMFFRFKKHGEYLNSISEGMDIAVKEQMKSERMKTELITNVSHDIKTPLTSIINYSDLITKEDCDNERITEYAEVISRQSTRLKRLLEDLLELSKSSTGNVDVNLEVCDAGILLSQATGEYEEKLKAAGLTVITTIPSESMYIKADRRLLWRVFDNLLSNMSKYALSGTRAFFSLSKEGNNVVFRFKNTSRDLLNITAEELKARFVRGDSSRNTEGNGLGLSIAENLANAQGGKLNIFIDADLFVTTITFAAVDAPKENVENEECKEDTNTTQTDSV